MNKIEIINLTNKKIEELIRVEEVLTYACQKEKLEDVVFNVIIVNDEKIQELNRLYRFKDKPTDVITFALEDDKTMVINSEFRVLGDIYISFDKVMEQSNIYHHSLLRELSFLAVHGFYHLLGYDHETKEEEEEMFKLQEEVLEKYEINR